MSDGASLKNYAIGIVLFGLIITGGIFMINGLISENPEYIDTGDLYYQTFTNDLDILNKSISVGNNFNADIEDVDGESGGDGSFLDSLFGGSWKNLQNFGTTYTFMGKVYTSSARVFGIPLFVVEALGAIISIIIAFAIFSAIFQRKL